MFLLVCGRQVGAQVDGHQHGVSIQTSINWGQTFLRISRLRKVAVIWILARVFAYLPSFFFQILNFIYWKVFIFILVWRNTEYNFWFVWIYIFQLKRFFNSHLWRIPRTTEKYASHMQNMWEKYPSYLCIVPLIEFEKIQTWILYKRTSSLPSQTPLYQKARFWQISTAKIHALYVVKIVFQRKSKAFSIVLWNKILGQ